MDKTNATSQAGSMKGGEKILKTTVLKSCWSKTTVEEVFHQAHHLS